VHAAFFGNGLVDRIAFFYAPKILGGCNAPKSISGPGINQQTLMPLLRNLKWKHLGKDLFLTALVDRAPSGC
jgi:diaminohydroxyphosphoribosylaminopyrimidine deaminase/5-amino-6-(5-phosphoribosylamino)uracil reductase